mmetsp:Transcript_6035/g.13202  ORF Transcript_6035/g.13202 Transcript_6035/m.13202 type:complete len:447 (-) Transcript_6035:636-1976(-)
MRTTLHLATHLPSIYSSSQGCLLADAHALSSSCYESSTPSSPRPLHRRPSGFLCFWRLLRLSSQIKQHSQFLGCVHLAILLSIPHYSGQAARSMRATLTEFLVLIQQVLQNCLSLGAVLFAHVLDPSRVYHFARDYAFLAVQEHRTFRDDLVFLSDHAPVPARLLEGALRMKRIDRHVVHKIEEPCLQDALKENRFGPRRVFVGELRLCSAREAELFKLRPIDRAHHPHVLVVCSRIGGGRVHVEELLLDLLHDIIPSLHAAGHLAIVPSPLGRFLFSGFVFEECFMKLVFNRSLRCSQLLQLGFFLLQLLLICAALLHCVDLALFALDLALEILGRRGCPRLALPRRLDGVEVLVLDTPALQPFLLLQQRQLVLHLPLVLGVLLPPLLLQRLNLGLQSPRLFLRLFGLLLLRLQLLRCLDRAPFNFGEVAPFDKGWQAQSIHARL